MMVNYIGHGGTEVLWWPNQTTNRVAIALTLVTEEFKSLQGPVSYSIALLQLNSELSCPNLVERLLVYTHIRILQRRIRGGVNNDRFATAYQGFHWCGPVIIM